MGIEGGFQQGYSHLLKRAAGDCLFQWLGNCNFEMAHAQEKIGMNLKLSGGLNGCEQPLVPMLEVGSLL